MIRPTAKKTARWVVLGCILASYLLYLGLLRPARGFGAFHDETIYFSSAKALVEGRGYIIPSFPGTPPQTMYPILYPAFLSVLWKLDPSFPGNIVPAMWLTALFGCWFLLISYEFLRKLPGLGDNPALLLVGFCALHPTFLRFSGAVLTDIPFAAMALTAMVLADSTIRRDASLPRVFATAIVAGLATDIRVVGLAGLAGIIFFGLYRRAHVQTAAFVLGTSPFLAAAFWWANSFQSSRNLQSVASGSERGWQLTWASYTSYWGFWKLSVPNLHVFLRMLEVNAMLLVVEPGRYLLAPLVEGKSLSGVILCLILDAGFLAGIVRLASHHGLKPVHFFFLFYCGILLIWEFPAMGRFLLVFEPLILAGFWLEGRRLSRLVFESFGASHSLTEKSLAGTLCVCLVALLGAILTNYINGGRSKLRHSIEERASILPEKLQAYDWLKQHTSTNQPIIAFEDSSLYLYTGRPAVQPIVFSLEWLYMNDTRLMELDLAHITDTARHVRAQFWLASDDDFPPDSPLLVKQNFDRLKFVLPLIFHSRENKVQIYDASCLLESRCSGE